MNIKTHELTEAALNGTWKEYDGARFFITCSKTPAFQRAITKRVRKHGQQAFKRDLDLMVDITKEAMAETVLKGWEGVNVDGVEFPATAENKLAMMELPEFREWLTETAGELENFKAEAVAADVDALKSSAPVAS